MMSGEDQKLEEGWFELESRRSLLISAVVPTQSVSPTVVSTQDTSLPKTQVFVEDRLPPAPVTPTPVTQTTTTTTTSKPTPAVAPPSLFETVVQKVSFQSTPVPPAPTKPQPEPVKNTEPVRFVVQDGFD
jgi:hypothetical protein